MITDILNTLTPYGRKMFAASIVGFSLYYLSSVAMVLVTLTAISDVIEGGHHLWIYALVLIGLLAVKSVAGIWADKQKHCAGFDLVFQIRSRVVRRLKKLPLGYYTKGRLGEISEIIHSDVDTMEMIVGHLWTRMIADFVVSTIVLVGFVIFCWPLALLMISTLPFAIAYLVWGLKHAQRLEQTTGDAAADMSSLFVEYVRGMSVLKAFSRSRALDTLLEDSVARFAQASGKAARNRAFVLSVYGLLMNLSLVVLITGGLLLSLNGTVTPLIFLVFVVVSVEFYKPFKALEAHWMNYLKCADSYRRIRSVTDAPVLPQASTARVPTNGEVVFDHVSFVYSPADGPALNNVSFQIPHGTVAALVGPSGAGKSTITSLLLRFWDVTDGSIQIGGVDLREMADEVLLEQISIVMQNVYLFADTIADNIRVGKRNASLDEIVAAAKAARIHEDIMTLPDGYDTVIGENGVGLSGGQRQRLSVARAFLKDSPIVVLDEITANVDPVNEALMQEAISDLTKDRTVIVIAHHLRTIQTADQIFVLNDGRIIESGTHSELVENPGSMYRSMWATTCG